MLYCLDELDDGQGTRLPMAGLMPGRACMQSRLAALGLQEMPFTQGRLRGHTFHYSKMETFLTPSAQAANPNGGTGEMLYRHGTLIASYMHGYFPSCPAATAAIFGSASNDHGTPGPADRATQVGCCGAMDINSRDASP
jgi:cobyrinic acid a,c-diamide synthase